MQVPEVAESHLPHPRLRFTFLLYRSWIVEHSCHHFITSSLPLIIIMIIKACEHDKLAPGDNKACLMTGVNELSMTTREVPTECGPWE